MHGRALAALPNTPETSITLVARTRGGAGRQKACARAAIRGTPAGPRTRGVAGSRPPAPAPQASPRDFGCKHPSRNILASCHAPQRNCLTMHACACMAEAFGSPPPCPTPQAGPAIRARLAPDHGNIPARTALIPIGTPGLAGVFQSRLHSAARAGPWMHQRRASPLCRLHDNKAGGHRHERGLTTRLRRRRRGVLALAPSRLQNCGSDSVRPRRGKQHRRGMLGGLARSHRQRDVCGSHGERGGVEEATRRAWATASPTARRPPKHALGGVPHTQTRRPCTAAVSDLHPPPPTLLKRPAGRGRA